MRSIALVLGAALASCSTPPPAPAPPSGDELRQRTLDLLLKASSLQWTVELEIEANTARLLEGLPRRQTWSFKIKGPSKAYWTSGPGMEFWYEEPTLTSSVGGQLASRDFGKAEGSCVIHALIKGGMMGGRSSTVVGASSTIACRTRPGMWSTAARPWSRTPISSWTARGAPTLS